MMITRRFSPPSVTVVTLVTIACNVVFLLMAICVQALFGVEVAHLYRDPNAVAAQPFVVGWLSNLGAVFWIVAATTSLMAYAQTLSAGRPALSLGFLGGFSLLMGADDLFMIHDGLFEYAGIPGAAMYVSYMVILALWFATCRSEILSGRWFYLALALICFGSSIAIDIIDDLGILPWKLFVPEDAMKLAGASFWMLYAVSTAWASTAIAARPARAPDPLPESSGRIDVHAA